MSSNIKVVCRFRPPNALELKESGGESIVSIEGDDTVKIRLSDGSEAPSFTFDKAFQMDTRQEQIFEYGIKETVSDVFQGYNGTVFAYGQTGSGKSHTMMGPDIDDATLKGIIPRITEQIFASIVSSPESLEYVVKVSYMEIYMERIKDLLAPRNDNLPIHEDKQRGVYVKNLSECYVASATDVYEVMRQGALSRAVSATAMNAESSRSHSIFVITVQQRNTETGSLKTGSLYLVDLAGSEKIGKTGATGQTLEEAKKINKSLSALGMVINSLTDGKSSHVPYRDSKLTRILQESLGGNSRTTLIINCSPSPYNEAETLSTLRFGMRAKSIKNKARVNTELSPAELRVLLKKAQREQVATSQYVGQLEGEVLRWRGGETVAEGEWVVLNAASAGSTGNAAAATASATPTGATAGVTPVGTNAGVAGIVATASTRSATPTPPDESERDEFLRRENELTDQVSKAESALAERERELELLRQELEMYKEQEATLSRENKALVAENGDMKLQLERVIYEGKEAAIVADAMREQNAELSREMEELRGRGSEATTGDAGENGEGGEGAEIGISAENRHPSKTNRAVSASHASRKAQKLAEIMAALDIGALGGSGGEGEGDGTAISAVSSSAPTSEMIAELRAAKDSAETRAAALEARVAAIQADYDDVVGRAFGGADADREQMLRDVRSQSDAQYTQRLDAAASALSAAQQQLETALGENARLSAALTTAEAGRAELERAFQITAAGTEGGEALASRARDLERVRGALAAQVAEFDAGKKALMRDLQDRCERVVELEIALDDAQEQYKSAVRGTNAKAQQRKLDFLARNLEQLTAIQKKLVEQNATLKKGVVIAERKLAARNERIRKLEQLLGAAQSKLQTQESQFEAEIEKLHQKREPVGLGGLDFSRIVKPIRGGGGATGAGGAGGATATAANDIAKRASEYFKTSSFFVSSPAR